MNRRQALRHSAILLGVSSIAALRGKACAAPPEDAAAGGAPAGAPASNLSPTPANAPEPMNSRAASQEKIVSVKDYGTVGDGRADDTAAIQRAVAALPAEGGIVRIPAGRYLINPEIGVNLVSNMRLELAPEAVLIAMATAEKLTAVLHLDKLENVVVSGGRIEGGAYRGKPPARGIGVDIRGGQTIQVENMAVSGFSMDAVYVGKARAGAEARDIVLQSCTLSHSKRQGITVTGCFGFKMLGCTVHDIGPARPGSGIDLEPNPGLVVDGAEIRNCQFTDCTGRGVQVANEGVSNVIIADNEFVRCKRGGIQLRGGTNVHASGNRVQLSEPAISVSAKANTVKLTNNRCGGHGIHLEAGARAERAGNDC